MLENVDKAQVILDVSQGTVADSISDYMHLVESDGLAIFNQNLDNLIEKILDNYPIDTIKMNEVIGNWEVRDILNDYQKIHTLFNWLKSFKVSNKKVQEKIKKIGIIKGTYEGYVAAIRSSFVEEA